MGEYLKKIVVIVEYLIMGQYMCKIIVINSFISLITNKYEYCNKVRKYN